MTNGKNFNARFADDRSIAVCVGKDFKFHQEHPLFRLSASLLYH